MNVSGDDALILGLDSPSAMLERVGGKDASLVKLATAGLPCRRGSTAADVHEDRF